MSKVWIPQWKKDLEAAKLAKQKQEEDLVKGMVMNDTNFPPLSSADKSSSGVVWNKKFSTLASEWKTDAERHAEEEKIKMEFHKSQDLASNATDTASGTAALPPKAFKLPQFTNAHRYVEEEAEDDEAGKPAAAGVDDNTWTLVDTNKLRRKKTFEEMEEQGSLTPDEDGVWKDDLPAEHETCWDERT
jgi:hypothetical protein